jgi:ABC-type polysaccharide/polyol phosphate export permease
MSLTPQWLRNIAALNPLSYAVDAARAVFATRSPTLALPGES